MPVDRLLRWIAGILSREDNQAAFQGPRLFPARLTGQSAHRDGEHRRPKDGEMQLTRPAPPAP